MDRCVRPPGVPREPRFVALQVSLDEHASTLSIPISPVLSQATAPAAGIAGWFGFTSTATVSLVSVQPWLIPVFAGFGLITVGTPIALLHACKTRWEKTTMELSNHFWSLADSDVIVEAIQSWSGVQ